MKRREFIRTGAAFVGGMTLPFTPIGLRAQEVVLPKAKVWLAKGDPIKAAQALADAIGLDSFVPPDGVVLLKPNIGFPAPPQWGATTDPDFLGAVIDRVIRAGAKRVIVVDHPVGLSSEQNLQRSGIGDVCASRPQVQVQMLDDEKLFRDIDIPQGKVLKQTKIAKILDKVNLFINIPTAKHHAQTGVSLGLKNLMGLIWNRVPLHDDMDLHQAIADLATVIKPQITFLNARYSLLTGGPAGPGQVENGEKYLAGFDPLAVDSLGVELARWNGRVAVGSDIPHLLRAGEGGIGLLDRGRIDLLEA
jgi:uncharacterized protein (DUF362 family)